MDFNLLTLAELKALAKEENIKGVTGLKKDELIAVLEENAKKKAGGAKKETASKSAAGKKAAAKSADNEKEAASKTGKVKAAKAEKEPGDKAEKAAPGKAAKAEKSAEEKSEKATASRTKKAAAEKPEKAATKKTAKAEKVEEAATKKTAKAEKTEEAVTKKTAKAEKAEEAVTKKTAKAEKAEEPVAKTEKTTASRTRKAAAGKPETTADNKAVADTVKTAAEKVENASEKAPAVRTEREVPVRSYDSQTTTRETVTPGQAGIRGNAPVRRPATGVRPMSDQRQAPVGRPAGDRPAGRPMGVRPGTDGRPMGVRPAADGRAMGVRPAEARPVADQRPVQARPAQEKPANAPQYQSDRAPFVPEGAGHAETLAAYIAQNYALAGSPQDSGETKEGILEVMPEGFAFVRCDNFLPGTEDVYVSPAQIKRYGLKTGDYIVGNTKIRMPNEKFSALLYINTVNKLPLEEIVKRKKFEDLTPIFPNQRFHLETPGCGPAMRMVDLLSPIGKGQRGMIVSQPKAGKTTLLKQIAKALIRNHPSIHLIILLIDERPEEVTDMKESISGDNVEVIYSTFDEQPENHKRVSEMVIERARRLVEQKQDVVILLDSITRLARAYNLTVQASGRTLSGGLDPAALHMPKKFFGAARCMREGGSLTVLATALVETGSRMDDVVFEEFKGTGNMELVLDRNLSERRVFPAIDLPKSGTRREDLLLTPQELEASNIIRRAFNSSHTEEVVERIINIFTHTRNNQEFVEMIKKTRIVP